MGELPETFFSGNHLRRQKNQNTASVERNSFGADPNNLSIPGRKVYRIGKNGQNFPRELR
jgi:hypothetical protein